MSSMSRPPSERRAQVQALRAEGLTQHEIASRLGVSRSLVNYYLGPEGAPVEAESSPPPEAPPVDATSSPTPPDHVLDTLGRLLHERDAAKSSADRIRASEAILRNLGSLASGDEWNPPPEVWHGFLRDLLASLPPSTLKSLLP